MILLNICFISDSAPAAASSNPPKPPRRVALLSTSRRSPIKNDASTFEAKNDANNLEKFVLRKSVASSASSRKASSSSLAAERTRKRKQPESSGAEAGSGPPGSHSGVKKSHSRSGLPNGNDVAGNNGEPVRVAEFRMTEKELVLSAASPAKKRRRNPSAVPPLSSCQPSEPAAPVPSLRTSPRKRVPDAPVAPQQEPGRSFSPAAAPLTDQIIKNSAAKSADANLQVGKNGQFAEAVGDRPVGGERMGREAADSACKGKDRQLMVQEAEAASNGEDRTIGQQEVEDANSGEDTPTGEQRAEADKLDHPPASNKDEPQIQASRRCP